MAAPVASKVLAEALPYLEVLQDNVTQDDVKMMVEVPNVVGMNYKEAKKVLQDIGLEIVLRNEIDEKSVPEDFTVSSQVPSCGVQVLEGGKIIVE